MTEITEKEKFLAARMLVEVSHELATNTCNDVDENRFRDWTIEERQNFVKEWYEIQEKPERYEPNKLNLGGYQIAHLLAHKLALNKVCYKTSEEWERSIPKEFNVIIIDHDGWNRENMEFSFEKELITKQEFLARLGDSTIQCKVSFFESEWVK